MQLNEAELNLMLICLTRSVKGLKKLEARADDLGLTTSQVRSKRYDVEALQQKCRRSLHNLRH